MLTQASLPDTSRRSRLVLVIGLPLLVLVLGAWQVQRGWSGLASLTPEATQLAAEADRMDAVAAATPNRPVRFNDDPQVYGAQQAARMLHRGAGVLHWQVLTDRVRLALALLTLGGGALSLLAGAAGLLAAASAARRSQRSRDALEAAFSRIRALLPVLLGGLAGGLALGVGAGLLFEVGGWLFATAGSLLNIRLVTPGLALAGAVLWLGWLSLRELRRSLAAFTPSPLPVFAREITAADAPGLWSFLAARAAEQGTAVPDHVAAGLVDGFFVTAGDVELLPGGDLLTGRTLHVPLPLLAMLDAGETAAIIGHELAHFAADIDDSRRFLPIYAGIGRSLHALRTMGGDARSPWLQSPAISLGMHMMAVFDGAVKHWSRLREIEADRAGAAHTGAEPAARALLRTALLQPAIDAVLGTNLRQPGALPPDLVAAAIAHAEATGLGDPAAALEVRTPHPTDSHPPTGQRLAALGLAPAGPLLAAASRPVTPDAAAFARSLFDDWPGLCAAVSADAIEAAAASHAQRQAWLHEAAGQGTGTPVAILDAWRRPAAGWGVFAAVLLGAGLLLAYAMLFRTVNDRTGSPPAWLVTSGLLAAGAAALLRAVRLWRGRDNPVMTLYADGFECRGLDRMVPWLGVERVSMAGQRSIHLFIHLKDTTKLPRRASGWRVQVSARRRVVTVLGINPRGLSPNQVLDLIGRHMTAAAARAELAGDPEPGYSAILSEEELQAMLSGDGDPMPPFANPSAADG